MKWEHWVNLRFYFIFSCFLFIGMKEGGEFKTSLPMSELVWFSACGVFVMIKLIMVDFCSIRGWSYSGQWVWDLRTLTQFQRSEMSLGLFQDYMNSIINRAEHGVVVVTTGYWSIWTQFHTNRWPLFLIYILLVNCKSIL